MSSKFLHALSDDPNLEKQLEKQIGCMTGIFQLFDRHQILTVKRLYSHKKLPAARLSSNCESPRPDSNLASQYEAGDANHRSSRDSVVHSNTEPSSRVTSRASSVEFGNNARHSASLQESAAPHKLETTARSSWDYSAVKCTNTKSSGRLSVDSREDASILSKAAPLSSLDSRQAGRLSLDIRDVVRDSFYREYPKFSVETKTDDRVLSKEGRKCVLKPKDSPRPRMEIKDTSKQQHTSINLSPKLTQNGKSHIHQASLDINGRLRRSADQASEDVPRRSRSVVDLNESLRGLTKLREAPWNSVDNKESPRPSFESKEGPRFSFSKDLPRFSFDGKEIPRSSSLKLREPPRLSLDSREIPRTTVDLKRNYSVKDSTNHKHSHSNGDLTEVEQQYREKKRSPSVVARLMGLEEMPADSPLSLQKREALNQCSYVQNSDSRTSAEVRKSLSYSKSIESPKQIRERENNMFEITKSHSFQPRFSSDRYNIVEETGERVLASPRNTNNLSSPRFKHLDSAPKPILTQKCPVETAPWKQQDGYHRKAYEGQNYLPDVTRKNEGPSRDLYGEIEKRLKQLELEHCDKDLKTLKQILDAMQHKGLLDSTKERFNQHQNDGDYTPRCRAFQESKPVSKTCEMQGNQLRSGACTSARSFEAPIVIMKPAKLVNKSSISAVMPMEGFPKSPRKLGSITQPGNANTKRSITSGNRILKDQQSGKPNYRESAVGHSNGLFSPKHHKREQNSRVKPEEHSSQVLQEGRSRSPSPAPRPPTRNQHSPKETMNSPKTNHPSCSPKGQRKKPETERKPKQTGSMKSPRQDTKKVGPVTENRSPRNRMRTKGSSVLQLDSASECSRDTVGDQCPDTPRVDEISVRSDSNLSSISQLDYEITSSERSYTSKFIDLNAEYDCKFDNENYHALQSTGCTNANPMLKKRSDFISDCKTSSRTTRDNVSGESMKLKDELHSKIEELQLNYCDELSTLSKVPEISEQPSPVSVLDASLFYKDDSCPSPVKKCSITFKEDETRQEDDHLGNADHWNNFSYQTDDRIPDSPIILHSNKILKNVYTLVRKLEDFNKPKQDMMEEDQQVKSLAAQNEAPEYKYIIEILSGSGLLYQDPDPFNSIEFHASGYPINPELFQVLEQKSSHKNHDQDRLNRELLFGTVNDILRRKLYPYLQHQPCISHHNNNSCVARRRPCGEELVKQVWGELQDYPCPFSDNNSCDTLGMIVEKDLSDNAERWSDYGTEISEVVLDVERMIFKDLIDETMGGLGLTHCKPLASNDQTVRTRRQLLY